LDAQLGQPRGELLSDGTTDRRQDAHRRTDGVQHAGHVHRLAPGKPRDVSDPIRRADDEAIDAIRHVHGGTQAYAEDHRRSSTTDRVR
jgi:hypothetical protein